MKKLMKLFLFFILAAGLSLTGCFSDEETSNTEESFELNGTWLIDIPTVNGTTKISTTFTNTTFTNDQGQKGKLVSFNNTEKWYIAQITEGASTMNGKYGMTKYTLSDDKNSFTGTSYSYEDTEAAAKASTTGQFTATGIRQ